MANAWNELYWGDGFWGLQGDGGVVLTGVGLSIQQGSTFSGEDNSWGQYTWGFGEWGDLTNPNVDVTGVGLTTSVGDEEISINIDLTLSTNLINISTGNVFAAANFEILVDGIQSNTTVNNVFAGENIVVQITTPGSPTTWGSGAWNSGAWGQLTGSLSEVGDETQIGTGSVDLIGTQINTTTTFIGSSIIGDANTSFTGVQVNSAVGSVNHIIDVTVDVTTPTSPSPWGEFAWGSNAWGAIAGMEVEQGGEEVVVPSIEVDVIGNQLNTTLGTYSITADANLSLSTNLLTVSLGDEDATPNTQVTLSTNLMTLSQGSASGETLSTISVTGVTVTSQVGRVFVSAWAVIDIGVTNTWTVVDIAA